MERVMELRRVFFGCLSLLVVVLIVLPVLLVRGCQPPAPFVPEEKELEITLYDVRQGKLITLPFEEYIKGVVAAEMPAEFNLEALKAQALASRTFAVKRMKIFGGPGCTEHPEADICNDIWHGQAWESKEELRGKWGLLGYLRYYRKISEAVEETRGQIITYQGELIDAIYHSTCGGSTENSEDVWNNAIPYLRAKECKFDAHSPRFHDTCAIEIKEMAEKLGVRAESIGKNGQNIKVLERTGSGRVKTIQVGDKIFKGTELRIKLGLRSTNFTWTVKDGQVIFTTTGNGHGVGLCQYGADGMGDKGMTYEEIIKYYYTGVQIEQMKLPQ